MLDQAGNALGNLVDQGDGGVAGQLKHGQSL
jgi:hypothetical protein